MSHFKAMAAENPGKYPSRMGQSWNKEEDRELLDMLSHKCSKEEIIGSLQRTPGSIKSRIELHVRRLAVKPTSVDIIAEELNVSEELILKVLKKARNDTQKEPVKEVPTEPQIEKSDMLIYLLADIKEILTDIRDNTRPVKYEAVEDDESDLEVEVEEYEGEEYLVDPKTKKIYTDDGDFIGYWYKDEPVLNPFRKV